MGLNISTVRANALRHKHYISHANEVSKCLRGVLQRLKALNMSDGLVQVYCDFLKGSIIYHTLFSSTQRDLPVQRDMLRVRSLRDVW